MANLKICRKCGEEKLLHEYRYRNDRGYIHQCKGCEKNYREEHKDEKKQYDQQYHQRNRDKINTYRRNKRLNDDNYKLACNVRTRLGNALKSKNIEKSHHTFDLIGCVVK